AEGEFLSATLMTMGERARERESTRAPGAEPEVVEAALNATRYEFEAARCTVIVELVDDAADEWVVRTAGGSRLTAEKELVRGRVAALRRARQIRVASS